ncbi:MAG: Gx transporter family protein [Tissierellia bacterium]|nr:Gx transporter family protein [Tissierellia bacterium]
MKNNKLRKNMYLALLVSLSLAISILELMIPLPVAIPGAKLGLSNIIILVTIYFYDFKSSITVSILKSILLMLVTGSVTSFFYSLSGAILSTIGMYLSLKFKGEFFSLIGVSEIGSFLHNLGQIMVACFVMNNLKIFYYLPILVIIGIFTGFFVGISSNMLIAHIDKLRMRIK